MRKYVLLFLSIFLIFLSCILVLNKRVLPSIDNKKYDERMANAQADAEVMIKTAEEKRATEHENAIKEAQSKIAEVPTSDGQRVGMYIGEYVKLINTKEYAKAYELLDDSFKAANFPTYEKYEQYVKEKYNRRKSVEYIKFTLENDIYIVETNIKDMSIYDDIQTFKQVFRFRELEPGNFKIAFGL